MFTTETEVKIALARTLWVNTYRGKVTDECGEYVATLRIIPGLPLDRCEVPEDAPEVQPYISVLVEDATITVEEMVPFETKVADTLLFQLRDQNFKPELCQFFYPSPPTTLSMQ